MRRRRKQTGHVYKRYGWWTLRYRLTVNRNGELETVQRAERLAPVDANHKTKRSLDALVRAKLDAVNKYRHTPETVTTIGQFVEQEYLPFVAEQKQPSTLKGYRDMWKNHVKPRCENILLRDTRTCMVQSWLKAIAKDKTENGNSLSHESLKHIKSLISGIFAHAKRQGFYDGINPVDDTAVPKAPKGRDTYAYSLNDISSMLMVLPELAATIVATAAFTGARRGEIRGMTWEGWHDGAIYINHSVWESYVGEPKTSASKAPIPVISPLAAMLEKHRERLGHPATGFIFPTGKGTSLSLNNVLTRQIKPVLNRCAICHKSRESHVADSQHEYQRDQSLPAWRGWHAFRRGLGTNLHQLGVPDKTIQAILRHSNQATTTTYYIKSVDADAVKAMQMLETLTCAKRALGVSNSASDTVN